MRNCNHAVPDTVAAVSTPFGKGGVALLRISGTEAVAIADRVFRPAGGRPFSASTDRTAVYGQIVTPDGDVIDDGVAVLFRAPRSFTGEDTVELTCHGGILITQCVLTALLEAGARQAEPGEFTRRAFVHGRMGLSETEALGNLLDAKSHEQLTLARGALHRGGLSAEVEAVYARLMDALANMEAGMDFPEEDLTDLTPSEIRHIVTEAQTRVGRLLDTYRTGHAIAEGIPTVICGKPNVGKSSFYNRLLGREAAIVTDVAGTTRDVLSESITVGRVTVRLFDTAGLHDTDDRVEQIGVARAKQALAEAELILALFDVSRPLDTEDESLLDELAQTRKAVVYVCHKADLADVSSKELTARLGENAPVVRISSADGSGLDELVATVESLYINETIHTDSDAVVFSARQNQALGRAAEHIEAALTHLSDGWTYDLCAEDIRCAMEALAELDGRSAREDVIGEIFSRFCVGK